MSAFADFIDLRTAVVEQVGTSKIANIFPRLVKLAEAQLNRKLRTRNQITEATVTVASGVAPLPADFLEVLALKNANGFEYIAQTPQEVRTGVQYYFINGNNLVAPGLTGDLTLQYYAALPTITDGGLTDSNWLLQKYPHVYLYACAFEAAKNLREKELASDMGGLLERELSDVYGDDFTARYSRARVRVAGPTP